MSIKAIFGYSLVGLCAVFTGISYFVLCTATGLSWYLNQNIEDSESKISIEEIANSLNGNCKILGLKLDTPFYQVIFSKLELSWNPLAVLRHEIDISSFSGENVSFRTQRNGLLYASNKGFQLPFALKIGQGSIKNLYLSLSDSYSESIQHVKMEQAYFDESLYVNKMMVTLTNGGAFEVSGKAGIRSGDVVNLTTKTTLTIADTGKIISTQGTIVGSPAKLKFLQNVNAPYTSRIKGSVDNLFTSPYWQFTVNVHSVNGHSINPQLNVTEIQGEVFGAGTLNELNISGDLTLEDSLSRRWQLFLTSSYDSEKAIFSINSTLPGKPAQTQIELKGDWDHLTKAQFPRNVHVAGKLENLLWPISEDSNIKIKKGTFKFEGGSLYSEFSADDVKLTSVGTQLTKLTLKTKSESDKHIALSGKARTSEGSIKFSSDLKQINLGYEIKYLSLTGQNFVLIRKPKAHIIISPDITLSRNQQTMQSRGFIKVPTANIQLQDVEETYNQFANLFFTNSRGSIASKQIIDQLNLKFGKSVWMHGYGLNAHVTGDLSLIALSNKNIVANGKLNILRGNYKNHNERFSVSGGILKFNKNQLDNPDLELQIVQKNNASSTPSMLKGSLQSLHTAQENVLVNESSQQKINRIAFNHKLYN
jgi:hypothetical protein